MSDLYGLLKKSKPVKIPYGIPVRYARLMADIEEYELQLKEWREECAHYLLLEYAQNRLYGRVCWDCGLHEQKPANNDGDEYNYCTFGPYRKLVVDDGRVLRNIAKVDFREAMRHRDSFRVR